MDAYQTKAKPKKDDEELEQCCKEIVDLLIKLKWDLITYTMGYGEVPDDYIFRAVSEVDSDGSFPSFFGARIGIENGGIFAKVKLLDQETFELPFAPGLSTFVYTLIKESQPQVEKMVRENNQRELDSLTNILETLKCHAANKNTAISADTPAE